MSGSEQSFTCPHCGQPLNRFRIPEASGWKEPFQWACFNNDCPYYRSGWDWMWENYRVKASYRYRLIHPESGQASPLAVWSETALLDRIANDAE